MVLSGSSSNNLISVSEFNITSAETDIEARLRPGALVNLLVQSAINSADSLGFGFGGIRSQNHFEGVNLSNGANTFRSTLEF